jgi:hypothetical protein
MRAWLTAVLVTMLAWPAAALVVADVDSGPAQDELDQLLAPVALYPDPLLAQLLMGATYPAEVAEAAALALGEPPLRGEALVRAVGARDWEASVKALALFPGVLAMMDAQPEWTRALGDAVLARPAAALDTVQALRALAVAQGTLRGGPEQDAVLDGEMLLILPARAGVIHQPRYDPTQAFGAWPWPDRPPLRWARPRSRHAPKVLDPLAAGVAFERGVAARPPLFGDARIDWLGRRLLRAGGAAWTHDPRHRRGVAYRSPAEAERFGAAPPPPFWRAGSPAAPEIIRPRPRPTQDGVAR